MPEQTEHRQMLAHSLKFNTRTWKVTSVSGLWQLCYFWSGFLYSSFPYIICYSQVEESVISLQFICIIMELSAFICLGLKRNYKLFFLLNCLDIKHYDFSSFVLVPSFTLPPNFVAPEFPTDYYVFQCHL